MCFDKGDPLLDPIAVFGNCRRRMVQCCLRLSAKEIGFRVQKRHGCGGDVRCPLYRIANDPGRFTVAICQQPFGQTGTKRGAKMWGQGQKVTNYGIAVCHRPRRNLGLCQSGPQCGSPVAGQHVQERGLGICLAFDKPRQGLQDGQILGRPGAGQKLGILRSFGPEPKVKVQPHGMQGCLGIKKIKLSVKA